ncbi:MAG: SPASM domain-containing protein, partial [Candidatus Thorarchaeota archaeon]
PGRSAIEWAERICPVASDVKISWNGDTTETQEAIMVGSDFERHLRNLEDFISVRDEVAERGHSCRVTLQLTFMERNLGEILGIIELAAEVGANRVKGHHLWVNSPEMENQSLRRNAESIDRWNKMLPRLLESVERYPLRSGGRVLLDNFFPLTPGLDEMVKGSICPFLGKEAWINHEGRFDPCCAPDDLRKTLGYFGNVTKELLRQIWLNPAYQDLCGNYSRMEVCSTCNMRRPPGRC